LQKIKEVEEKLDKLKKNYRKFASAINELGPKSKHEERKKFHKNEYRRLQALLESVKQEIQRKDLMGNAPILEENEKKPKKKKDVEVTVNPRTGKKQIKDKEMEDELFKDIYATQGDSIKIVERLIAKADETTELAQESSEMLKRQREQLKKIDERLDDLGTGITRGRQEVISFLRRVASDKIILLVIVLVVLAITALIIWKIIETFLPKASATSAPTPAPTTTSAPFIKIN
jgi:SNARE protein